MFGPRELDLRNVYKPNLTDIHESAVRTYGEANSFYRKEVIYLKDVEMRMKSGELSSEEDIYDECHAIASDLAKCCEMYLKALYLYEHNISGNQINEIWKKLKNNDFKTDSNGNLIYMTPFNVITFAKYDELGNPIVDKNGKIIYYDENGNIYNDNNRGAKIKINGHQLDRLIDLLSPEVRLLLEARMLTIPMDMTEKNISVSVLDVLFERGVISKENSITLEQYEGWIEQHKKTFEEARYSGEKHYDINVEFLYHLATQLKAVAQYIIAPKNNQKFTITEEELSKLPLEIKNLAHFNSNFLSEDLIKLIASDESVKNKVAILFSNQNIMLPTEINSFDFYNLLRLMDVNEILYLSGICHMLKNYDAIDIDENTPQSVVDAYKIADHLKSLAITSKGAIRSFIQLKESVGNKVSVGSEFLNKFFCVIEKSSFYNDYLFSNNKYDIRNYGKREFMTNQYRKI